MEPDKKTWSPESSSGPSAYEGDMGVVKRSFVRRMTESFQRDPNASVLQNASFSAVEHKGLFDAEAAAQNTASSPLLRRLKGRHLQMIAIGGSIGTWLLQLLALEIHILIFRQFRYRAFRWQWQGFGRWFVISPYHLPPPVVTDIPKVVLRHS